MNAVEQARLDCNDVLETFGDRPAAGCRAMVQLFARKAVRHAQQTFARFRKILQRQFALGGSHVILLSRRPMGSKTRSCAFLT